MSTTGHSFLERKKSVFLGGILDPLEIELPPELAIGLDPLARLLKISAKVVTSI